MSLENKQEPPSYNTEDLESGVNVQEKASASDLETEADSEEDMPYHMHGKREGRRGHPSHFRRGGKHFKFFDQGGYGYYPQFPAPPPPPGHHHHYHDHHAFGASGHHHHHGSPYGFGFPPPPPPPPPPAPGASRMYSAPSNDPYFHPFATKRKRRFTLKKLVLLAFVALSAFVLFSFGRIYESKELRNFHHRPHHPPHEEVSMQGGRHHGFRPEHKKPHHPEEMEFDFPPFDHKEEHKEHKEGHKEHKEHKEGHKEHEEHKGEHEPPHDDDLTAVDSTGEQSDDSNVAPPPQRKGKGPKHSKGRGPKPPKGKGSKGPKGDKETEEHVEPVSERKEQDQKQN